MGPARFTPSDGPKGPRFTKVYDKGWDRVERLVTLKGGPTVSRVWLFIVKHCGHENALVVSVPTMAKALDVHTRSVERAVVTLEASGALIVTKIGGTNCYILNDSEVWKTYEDHHRFCGFSAKAIVGFDENPGLRARLTYMQPQRSLPGVGDAEAV
jgi:hypothetical protein